MSSKVKPNEGDWICQGKTSSGVCGNVNFSGRTRCNKCSADMQKDWVYKKSGVEIGKQQAEKSGGLFSADDWMCKSCGNINWARRMKCNVCNASKVAKVDSRTGLGGGYKDRDDVVEYKERAESDDEFDEFGLKKKKFRGQTAGGAAGGDDEPSENADNKEKEEAHDDGAHRKIESEEGESSAGEEEEEEDDGDLDKYNLLDEDDIEDLVEKKKPSSRERSKRDEKSSGSSSSDSSSGSEDEEESGSGSNSGSSSESSDESGSESSSSSSSSPSSGSDRHRPRSREDRHREERKNRSRSRSPIDKNGRKEKHQSRR